MIAKSAEELAVVFDDVCRSNGHDPSEVALVMLRAARKPQTEKVADAAAVLFSSIRKREMSRRKYRRGESTSEDYALHVRAVERAQQHVEEVVSTDWADVLSGAWL